VIIFGSSMPSLSLDSYRANSLLSGPYNSIAILCSPFSLIRAFLKISYNNCVCPAAIGNTRMDAISAARALDPQQRLEYLLAKHPIDLMRPNAGTRTWLQGGRVLTTGWADLSGSPKVLAIRPDS
jgi:hypothetical protein